MNDKELIDRILGTVQSMDGYTVKIKGIQSRNPSILVEPVPPKYDEEIKEFKPFKGEWNGKKD